MTFLPIVEREMRVAARRRGTYGTRTLIAGLAALAFGVCYLASLVDPSISFVKTLFWGLSGMCLGYCLLAGRLMTADCLSREKREGTLGLLFLTDLKGFDVVFGKLAATSLDGLYGLLAVFPVLALPLLAGGMTGGEVGRMVLVLVNTFLFSAAIGLFVSAVSRDEQRVKGANLALLLCLAGLPPAIGLVLESVVPGFKPPAQFFYSCPVFSFWKCAAVNYKISPADFWWSIETTFNLTLACLLAACLLAPRSWRDKPVSARSLRKKGERRHRWWRDGKTERAAAFRRLLLDRNAYFWLAARPYLKAWHVWAAMGLLASLRLVTTLDVKNIEQEANVAFALLLSLLLKLWITTEAARQLAQDKKSGAFEVLLSTPLTVQDILRGQRLALRRQFLKPLVVAVMTAWLAVLSIGRTQDAVQIRWVWVVCIFIFVADAITLCWVAMLAGLTARSYARATLKTAAVILVLPWGLYGCAELAAHLFMLLFTRPSWDPDWRFDLGCYFAAAIFMDLLFGLRAWRRLRTNFRRLALEPFAPKRRFAWLRDWWTGSTERKAELRATLRRAAVVAALLLVVLASLDLYDMHVRRAHFPKPLAISITQSNTPLQVFEFPSVPGVVYFILQDGSLWCWGGRVGAFPPRRVGTNRNWVQMSVNLDAVGLQSDGTIWTWSRANETPRQVGSSHDWVEVRSGDGFNVARNRDGRLWAWGRNKQNQLGNGPGPNNADGIWVGTNSDWKAVSATGAKVVALRGDGALWTWGDVAWFGRGTWSSTNFPFPIRYCAESNWTGLAGRDQHLARNQKGETWTLSSLTGMPGPGVPIESISTLVSSNAALVASGPLYTTNWTHAKYELQSNGTLWATPELIDWLQPNTFTALGPPIRIGRRSDWAGIWGVGDQTMIGLTSDGMLWTWGADYGQESHWTQVFAERSDVIKEHVGYVFGHNLEAAFFGFSMPNEYPAQKEPRPLLRMVQGQSDSAGQR
jgi:hypothetical protein